MKATIEGLVFIFALPVLLMVTFNYSVIKSAKTANLSRSPAVISKEAKVKTANVHSLRANIYNYLITKR